MVCLVPFPLSFLIPSPHWLDLQPFPQGKHSSDCIGISSRSFRGAATAISMSTGGFPVFLCLFSQRFSLPIGVVTASRVYQSLSGLGCAVPLLSHQGLSGEESKAENCVLLHHQYFCTCCVGWLSCCGTECRQKGIPLSPPS